MLRSLNFLDLQNTFYQQDIFSKKYLALVVYNKYFIRYTLLKDTNNSAILGLDDSNFISHYKPITKNIKNYFGTADQTNGSSSIIAGGACFVDTLIFKSKKKIGASSYLKVTMAKNIMTRSSYTLDSLLYNFIFLMDKIESKKSILFFFVKVKRGGFLCFWNGLLGFLPRRTSKDICERRKNIYLSQLSYQVLSNSVSFLKLNDSLCFGFFENIKVTLLINQKQAVFSRFGNKASHFKQRSKKLFRFIFMKV